MSDIKQAIESILKSKLVTSTMTGKVVDFDESTYTATVKMNANDLEIDKVRVRSIEGNVSGTTLGLFIQPKINSIVQVSVINNDIRQLFISAYSEIEFYKIKTNDVVELQGNDFGGLIKIDNLKTQYDANIAAIKTAVIAGFTAVDTALNAIVPLSGVSVAAFNASAGTITNLNKNSLENTNVKHG